MAYQPGFTRSVSHSSNLSAQDGLPSVLMLSRLVYLPLRLAVLPWSALLYTLSLSASLLLRFLVVAGAPPPEYTSNKKVRELAGCVEHLQQREDAYRRKIKELQEECETRARDRQRALVKLARARGELGERTLELDELRALSGGEASSARGGANHDARGGGRVAAPRWLMHASTLAAFACVWWFFNQSGFGALERKLLSGLLFPLVWVYIMALTARRPGWSATFLYCASWLLIGFVAAHKVGARDSLNPHQHQHWSTVTG